MDGKSASAKFIEEMANGEYNPFHTLEALREVIGAAQYVSREFRGDENKVGSLAYYLKAADEKADNIFQHFAALEHDLYLASDGDMAALSRLKDRYLAVAADRQREWDEIHFR